MKITAKQIKELNRLYKDKKIVAEQISDAKKTYQDRYGKNLVKLTRAEKEIELEENTLWQELYYGGVETQAGEILKGKYPELFALLEKDTALNMELNNFTAKNWGFFFNQMSLSILIDLVLALIKYQLNPINWFRK